MRFFAGPERWDSETMTLDAAESHHAAAVLRVTPGQDVVVFDGEGRSAAAEVASVSKKETRLRLGEITRAERLPRIVVATAVPKGQTMDWIIEKAVELGASEIVPLLTERTIVRLSGEERAQRAAKWQRIAIEACKQCGQAWLPQVSSVASLLEAITRFPASEVRLPLVASLQPDARPLDSFFERRKGAVSEKLPSAMMVVGPEGDFTEREYDLLRSRGFQPVSFGQLVLRVETAVSFGLSVLRYELGRGSGDSRNEPPADSGRNIL